MRRPGPPVWGSLCETITYDNEFCGTCTREWLLWQGPEAIVRENYRPILSSEKAPHSRNSQLSNRKQKSGHGLQMGARHQDRMAD
jgi:hypothetical protein